MLPSRYLTKTSDAALDDTFCRQRVEFPLKEVLSSGEKALLAFLMLESIQVEQDRSGVPTMHQGSGQHL